MGRSGGSTTRACPTWSAGSGPRVSAISSASTITPVSPTITGDSNRAPSPRSTVTAFVESSVTRAEATRISACGRLSSGSYAVVPSARVVRRIGRSSAPSIRTPSAAWSAIW